METTLEKTTYKGWAGILAFSIKDNQKYICLVQDRTGLWGFPGGKIEDEKTNVAAIREALEETGERIFARDIKKIWEGSSSDLYIKAYESHFTIFKTDIPYFNHREIKDGAIVKAQNFHINFFLNTILKDWKMRAKDSVLVNKLGKEYFLNA